MASVRVIVPPGINRQILAASREAVGRDMLRRGLKVESLAKVLISSDPKRVNTGRLRSSIKTSPLRFRGANGAQVGTNVNYALYVHEGTGLYGPNRRVIRAASGKVFAFEPKGARRAALKASGRKRLSRAARRGITVFSKTNRGMRPNPFLRNALRAAKD